MTTQHYIRDIVQDPDQPDELLLDLGNDLCDQLGWQVGDVIEWQDNHDGSWTLTKQIPGFKNSGQH